MGLTVGHQRADRRQLPHHARPVAGRGPPDARRPAHADRRPLQGHLSRGGARPALHGVRSARPTECAGCGPELDPPRFCSACGKRLTVQVTPAGWTSRCNRCGEVTEPQQAGSVGEVLGRLADLPVAVLLRLRQRGVDLGPSNGASASTARRRTVALSPVARRIAGRPSSSPMAPSAATAASRTSASSCVGGELGQHRATTPSSGGVRSPLAQAATSTTVASVSPSTGTSATPASPGDGRRPRRPGGARPRRGRRARLRRLGAVSRSSRSRAPKAVARTPGSASPSAARAVVSSPWWPASATAGGGRRRSSQRPVEEAVADQEAGPDGGGGHDAEDGDGEAEEAAPGAGARSRSARSGIHGTASSSSSRSAWAPHRLGPGSAAGPKAGSKSSAHIGSGPGSAGSRGAARDGASGSRRWAGSGVAGFRASDSVAAAMAATTPTMTTTTSTLTREPSVPAALGPPGALPGDRPRLPAVDRDRAASSC